MSTLSASHYQENRSDIVLNSTSGNLQKLSHIQWCHVPQVQRDQDLHAFENSLRFRATAYLTRNFQHKDAKLPSWHSGH